MLNESTNDLKLIGFQYPPEEHFDALREILKDSNYETMWAMCKAYNLGVMHGKRADRKRRVVKNEG